MPRRALHWVGAADAPGAATGLALLPFLGRGYTHETRGPYKQRVYAAVNWLLAHQKPTGDLSVTGGQTQTYSHAIATIALCEAYAMTHDKRLEMPARAGLHVIVKGQDQQTGGWRYVYRAPGGDTSVFGWQLTALETGRKAGLGPPQATFDLAKKWLEGVSHGDSKGLFSYRPLQEPADTMTAVGLLGTQYLGARRDDPRLPEGTRFLMSQLPELNRRNIYYWYYATQAMHNMPGADWVRWNDAIRKVLLQTQTRGAVSPPEAGTPPGRYQTHGSPRVDA